MPAGEGLTYVTLRFDFPGNIDISGRGAFNPLVTDVIILEYGDGSVEWTLLFSECPSDWVWLFGQPAVILDRSRTEIRIDGANSMIRDCSFVLNGIGVLGGVAVNEPGCAAVSAGTGSWGAVKRLFRQGR